MELVKPIPEPKPETDHEAIQEWVDHVNQRSAAERRQLQNRINSLIEQTTQLQRALGDCQAAVFLMEASREVTTNE